MAQSIQKIADLRASMEKIEAELKNAEEARRREVGLVAEKMGVHHHSDEAIAGALASLREADKAGVEALETIGAKFLGGKSGKRSGTGKSGEAAGSSSPAGDGTAATNKPS